MRSTSGFAALLGAMLSANAPARVTNRGPLLKLIRSYRRTSHLPDQGDGEIARRRRQIERGTLRATA